MPNTYIQDVKDTVDALSMDDGLPIEGRLILLDRMMDYLMAAKRELEGELAMETDGQTTPTPEPQN